MPKKEQTSFDDLISELKTQSEDIISGIPTKEINAEGKTISKIVDIITFCENQRYLNLVNQKIILRLSQRIILKCFYMGSRYNENLRLTDEEKQWLIDKNLPYVLSKIERFEKGEIKDTDLFNHLVLVIGRRSGKTFLCSIIAAYEAYKLLELPGGCPQEYYRLPQDNEIVILNVARSTKQAKVLFNEIASRIRRGPYFKNRLDTEST